MTEYLLNDAMPHRPLTARWVFCGELVLTTAMHLRGDDDHGVDMSILRDARTGKPLLPGTTLTGALRNALADVLAGYETVEHREVATLFGGNDENNGQSPMMVFDSIGELPSDGYVEIRDGVSILPQTGIAEDRKKYDYEAIPAGTKFPVRIDLLLPIPGQKSKEEELLAHLAVALDAFSDEKNSLGAKRSRGLGRMKITWMAKRFDLSSQTGWYEWLLSDHIQPVGHHHQGLDIYNAILAAVSQSFSSIPSFQDMRSRCLLDLEMSLAGDILVRSPASKPDSPDVVQLRSGGKPVLPGTSLAGVMRSQALRIAKLVRNQHNDAELWVNRLFGPRFENQRPQHKLAPSASRLRVEETMISGSRSRKQTRIAIDRFTQSPVDTALFDEQTEVDGKIKLCLELRNPKPGEMGLILLVVKDLLDGRLPVGGASSVGRGVVHGFATIQFAEKEQTKDRVARVEPGQPPTGDAAPWVDQSIREFCEAKSLHAQNTNHVSQLPNEREQT